MEVKAWEEVVKIPTYKIGAPDKNPMFLEKRVYQGSSGVVYPHPVIDKVYDDKEDKEYKALYLENDYLKVMVLPELGGRIQMAFDKTNDYHFIYHNSVIKPALVGLAGPWISGGIEFNWPQHHRPSTFDAVDYTIEENKDGSKTIWVNEYEIMFRTKCALGFTLYPDKAYIELHAKLYNRTPFPQTFLWWANPAVAVDEHYQSVFPPDVNAVFDHGKRDVSTFPIATGTYYKVDYAPGTDISRYTNIPVPTSYMAVNSEFNFVGGYHHQKKAGMVHVADHHVSPGKKQWTWGCGEFGKAWDRQLTDNDGPYFELMCGVFTDNQPDFSWIMPNEVRTFTQYFMPYKNVGYIKNATIDAVVNLEISDQWASIKVYTTQEREVVVTLHCDSQELLREHIVLSPTITFEKEIDIRAFKVLPEKYYLKVADAEGKILVDYTPVTVKEEAIPDPASPIAEPENIVTNEALFLAGLHLEQYRHATYNPEDYYKEALQRDVSDIRCNNALGLLYMRRGEFAQSEIYLRSAVEKLNAHNPNPYDSEPLYNLGLCLQMQKRWSEAETMFFKCSWNTGFQDTAFLQLSYIAAVKNNWKEVSMLVSKSLMRNGMSLKAKHLKAIAWRKLDEFEMAFDWINSALAEDQFDFGSRYELYTILNILAKTKEAEDTLAALQVLMRNNANNYIEIAIDYGHAGEFEMAYSLLMLISNLETTPMLFYYLGHYAYLIGKGTESVSWYTRAFACEPHKVFPNRIEDIEVLQEAIKTNPVDYKAYYYLGNYYYGKRRYEDAKNNWEHSVKINASFATTNRNLGIAYFNKFDDKEKALQFFQKAFACDPSDSRVLFELDQLQKRFKKKPEDRLHFLMNYRPLVEDRDDLYIEFILLHSLTNRFDEALELLKSRNFHPWEGGEGKTSGQHIHVHVALANRALANNDFEKALILLQDALVYPENLGEGKLHGAQENDIYYWMGCAKKELELHEAANECFQIASVGLSEPAAAIFYNDQQPDKIFYQGLALLQLGETQEAETRFNNLIEYGKANINKLVKMDFFAVSLPDLSIFDEDLSWRNNIHCHYLQALGYLGLENYALATECFDKVLEADPAHLGGLTHYLQAKSKMQPVVKVVENKATVL